MALSGVFVVVFCDYGVIRPQDLTMAIRPLGLFVLFVFSPKSYLRKEPYMGLKNYGETLRIFTAVTVHEDVY